jgi:hypothetical protein
MPAGAVRADCPLLGDAQTFEIRNFLARSVIPLLQRIHSVKFLFPMYRTYLLAFTFTFTPHECTDEVATYLFVVT